MRSTNGTIICLNCARTLGEVMRHGGQVRLLRLSGGAPERGGATGRIRCGRCNGSPWVEWD
jgi:hypothetical protein